MFLLRLLRILLFPLSVLYGVIVSVRNLLYDVCILKSSTFKKPLITVGNLSVGGTGKTPQIEYLIRLLQNKYNVAVLSRGYKRKSKGFVLADKNATVLSLGDEPFQYHQKFDKIQVAVNGDRVEGVTKILETKPNTEVILLDDAYQHRKIKAGYQILLSSYDSLFYNDFMMPTGNLRELWWGTKRANVIIVTKCPKSLSATEQQKIINRLKPKKQQKVFFSTISYANEIKGSNALLLKGFVKQKITVITGIAKPKPLLDYLRSLGANFEHLEFPDHHHFTKDELNTIQQKGKNSKILTTEKDYVRLVHDIDELYYLPIETKLLNNAEVFDKEILSFVAKC